MTGRTGERRALAVHGALARGAFAVAVLISLAVLFAPGSDVPGAPPGVDKLVHLSVFAALALTGRWAGVRERLLAAVLVLYAATSEVLQGLLPIARDAAWGDLVADLAGLAAGLLAWRAAAPGRRRRG